MLRRHAPPPPPAARARELRAPHAPAPCTHTPRRVPGPAGLPRGASGVTGISGANIGFDLPHLKRASHPDGGLSGKSMRPARPPGLAKSLCDAPARVPCCHANAKRKRKRKRMLARAGAPRETRYRFSENGSRTDPFTVRVRGTGRYTRTPGQCLTLPACCQLHTHHCIPSQLTVVFHSRALFIIDHAHHALHRVVLHTEIKCNQNAGFYMPQVPGIWVAGCHGPAHSHG